MNPLKTLYNAFLKPGPSLTINSVLESQQAAILAREQAVHIDSPESQSHLAVLGSRTATLPGTTVAVVDASEK